MTCTFFGAVRRFSLSVKGVVCVWLPCPCLRLMSRPLRGWHWTAVPFWTIALARVSDNTIASVLSLAPFQFLSGTNRIIPLKTCFLPHGSMMPDKNMSSRKWKSLFVGLTCWSCLLSCKIDTAYFTVCRGYLSARVGQHRK